METDNFKRWGIVNKTTKQIVFQSDSYGEAEAFILMEASPLYTIKQLAEMPSFIWRAEGYHI